MTYNLTLVLKSDLKDTDRKKITKAAAEAFGKVRITEKDWGEKKLAYPIMKQSTGFYVSMIAEGEVIVANDFEKNLYRNENILRHLLLRQ